MGSPGNLGSGGCQVAAGDEGEEALLLDLGEDCSGQAIIIPATEFRPMLYVPNRC